MTETPSCYNCGRTTHLTERRAKVPHIAGEPDEITFHVCSWCRGATTRKLRKLGFERRAPSRHGLVETVAKRRHIRRYCVERCGRETGAYSSTGRRNPAWCPRCDEVRIERISRQLEALASSDWSR